MRVTRGGTLRWVAGDEPRWGLLSSFCIETRRKSRVLSQRNEAVFWWTEKLQKQEGICFFWESFQLNDVASTTEASVSLSKSSRRIVRFRSIFDNKNKSNEINSVLSFCFALSFHHHYDRLARWSGLIIGHVRTPQKAACLVRPGPIKAC